MNTEELTNIFKWVRLQHWEATKVVTEAFKPMLEAVELASTLAAGSNIEIGIKHPGVSRGPSGRVELFHKQVSVGVWSLQPGMPDGLLYTAPREAWTSVAHQDACDRWIANFIEAVAKATTIPDES